MSKNYASGNKVTMERTFNAPIALVWEAWIKPEHIAKWWGPQGMETEILEHDFRVGGKWKYGMKMPDGNLFISEGVYTEIVEKKRIVTSADFRPMTEGVELQMIFEEQGDQTHFTFHVIHSSEDYRIQQEKMGIYNGWGSVFERLGTFLSESA